MNHKAVYLSYESFKEFLGKDGDKLKLEAVASMDDPNFSVNYRFVLEVEDVTLHSKILDANDTINTLEELTAFKKKDVFDNILSYRSLWSFAMSK